MKVAKLALVLSLGVSASGQVAPSRTRLNEPAQIRYASLPLAFEPNVGQTDAAVKYVSRGNGYGLFFTETEAVISLAAKDARTRADRRTDLRMHFDGGNPKAMLEPCDPLPSKSNFFIGSDPAQWRTDVPNYARVQYHDVYPGVDVIFYGNQRQLEYDLLLSPGADPGKIRLKLEGVERIETEKNGDLVLVTSVGQLLQRKPIVYQKVGAERRKIESRYKVRGNQVEFEVARYDAREPLVIDPIIVVGYGKFLGGSGLDQATSIATDGSGNAYVAGFTNSTDFPNPNGIFPAKGSVLDAFVAKFNSTGTLVYSTYLGGNASDQASAVAADASGNVYVTGSTSSTNFPTTVSALQSSLTGATNAFVAKINSAGNALTYSTYLGGIKNDQGSGIAADASGNAYITGFTSSQDFPHATAQQTPIQGSNGGALGTFDAWVAKIDATGAHLVYATYLGGMSDDEATAIAVDSATNVYVSGWTQSSDFPHQNGLQTMLAGNTNAFVTKINAAGTAIVYSTYLGGSAADEALAIAVDAANPPNVYAAGFATSANFPHTNGLFTTLKGTEDAFVSKINSAGTALVYSTYLGGSGSVDVATAIAADSVGNAYVVGNTNSSDFPLAIATQGTFGGGTKDAFLSKFSPDGSSLVYSAYLGGTGDDAAGGVAVDANARIYVAGGTSSADFPNMSNTYNAMTDAFVLSLKQLSPAKAAIFRNGLWVIDLNDNFQWDGTSIDRAIALGQSGDIPVTGDWNGDGRKKAGIFRNGLWVLDYNGNGQWDGTTIDRAYFLGQAGDIPVVGDWNGSGFDKIGIFRNGLWVLDYNGNGQWDGPGAPANPNADVAYTLGQAGDVPVVGDWNGSGWSKFGVFRNGLWVLDYNGNFQWDGTSIDRAASLGQSGDVPVVGDWNGSGKSKIGIFRNGLWVLDYNGNFQWDGPGAPGNPNVDVAYTLGQTGDTPVVGDWNASGWSKIGVFRNGLWVFDYNGNFQWDGTTIDRAMFLGQMGDVPVPAKW